MADFDGTPDDFSSLADQIERQIESLPRAVVDPSDIADKWRIRERTILLNINSLVEIAPADANRISLIFAPAVSGGTIFASTRAGVAAGGGIPFFQGGMSVQFNFKHHGGLCQVTWYARSTGGTSNITVIETSYRPRG